MNRTTRPKSITIDDVSRAAGVSVSTVSRVIRGHVDVRESTRNRVLEVVKELGYRPSPIARALVSGRSQTLGLLVSDITNPFYPQLAKSIEHEARKLGYTLVICNTEDSVPETLRYVQRLLDQDVEGIIQASVGQDEADVLSLVGNSTPIVFTNRRPQSTECSYVVADNVAGGLALGQHLLEQGYRRIGFINGPRYASNAHERLEGLREAVRSSSAGADLLVAEGDFSRDSGARGARLWLGGSRQPTAMVGVNDSVALGALECVLEAGFRVPADIAVAGFDDIDLASSRLIGLTSVAQHIDRMGRRAVRILMRLLQPGGPRRPIQEVIEPKLLVRRTTLAAAEPVALVGAGSAEQRA